MRPPSSGVRLPSRSGGPSRSGSKSGGPSRSGSKGIKSVNIHIQQRDPQREQMAAQQGMRTGAALGARRMAANMAAPPGGAAMGPPRGLPIAPSGGMPGMGPPPGMGGGLPPPRPMGAGLPPGAGMGAGAGMPPPRPMGVKRGGAVPAKIQHTPSIQHTRGVLNKAAKDPADIPGRGQGPGNVGMNMRPGAKVAGSSVQVKGHSRRWPGGAL